MPSFSREIGAVENIHGALPYIPFAPILALVGVGVNRIGKVRCSPSVLRASRSSIPNWFRSSIASRV